MATEFSRLYRELCHSGPNDPILDLKFNRERKQVLKTLGYDIKSAPDKLKLSKHHGKGARRRAHEARLNAISVEKDVERKKEKEIRALSQKTNEVNELTTQIQTLLAQNKFVSNNLWAKYDKIYGEHTEMSPSLRSKAQKPKATPTIPRAQSTIRFDYSENKWTKQEREKLNSIYWDLQKPSAKSVAAWENYYAEFASIFRIFYSKRSENEVIEKIKDLYASRQFVEKGESEYWKKVQTESSPKGKRNEDGEDSAGSAGATTGGSRRQLPLRGKLHSVGAGDARGSGRASVSTKRKSSAVTSETVTTTPVAINTRRATSGTSTVGGTRGERGTAAGGGLVEKVRNRSARA